MPRARAVIFRDGAVALIERHRDGRRYFVVPGGSGEPGETAHEAVAREAWEELGLRVEVGALVAEVPFEDDVKQFFLATVVGGTFGGGRGREMVGGASPGTGTYRPFWVPIADLPRLPLPASVTDLIAAWLERRGARAVVDRGKE